MAYGEGGLQNPAAGGGDNGVRDILRAKQCTLSRLGGLGMWHSAFFP